MAAEVMKVEMEESETCCVCGGGGDLMTPEEHDAGAPPMQVPLRAMLLHLNTNKVVPDGRFCGGCIRRAMESYEFSMALTNRGTPPLSEKIRALRKRLHELTQKIDVFIVVGGAGPDGAYSEDDIIMVERDTLAAAAAADCDELERGRDARGELVYQCSQCPAAFARAPDLRAHAAAHGAGAGADTHSCWTCGAQFAARAALRAHERGACAAALACALCGARGAGAGAGVGAGAGACSGACRARCPVCGAEFAARAQLAAHCAAAHGRAAAPPHCCPACFRTCDTPELLTAHLLRHRQAKQFVCGYDSCILRFATRSNLMSHIRKCHSSESAQDEPAPEPAPSTTCQHCSRSFGSVAAMKRHARVHRSTQLNNALVVQEEGNESQEGEDMEGEVEYLEVEELEEMEDRDDEYEDKPDLRHLL